MKTFGKSGLLAVAFMSLVMLAACGGEEHAPEGEHAAPAAPAAEHAEPAPAAPEAGAEHVEAPAEAPAGEHAEAPAEHGGEAGH